MAERAFARTFRNFSTIFMIVALVVFPLHVAYAFTFRDVIATSDYHDAIEAMPDDRRVGSVGPPQLDRARLAFWILTIGELALLPLAVRATRRTFEVDEMGGVPTATDAWADALSRRGAPRPSGGSLGPALVGLAVAVTCGLLIAAIGDDLTGFFGKDSRWAAEGMAQAVTRASALPFFLGPFAATRAKEEAPRTPKLY